MRRPCSGSGFELACQHIIPAKIWGRPSVGSFVKGRLAVAWQASRPQHFRKKQREIAGPGHSMHLWTHWNVVEAILVKNMLKWGRWCEVVMQRSSDFMQLKTYSESQIHTEKIHTIWVSNNTWKNKKKKRKKKLRDLLGTWFWRIQFQTSIAQKLENAFN